MEPLQTYHDDPNKMFLIPRNSDPPDKSRSFFKKPKGSNVPVRPPAMEPQPTVHEVIARYLENNGQSALLSILTQVNRDWCHGVRTIRFHDLELAPRDATEYETELRIRAFAPNLQYVRQLLIHGCLNERRMFIDRDIADHSWLNGHEQFLLRVCSQAPIEDLRLQWLSWGDLSIAIRASLRSLGGTLRALTVHEVDFWNSNQMFMMLNAYPRLQYLQLWHANYETCNHLPEQIARTEPLLLSELILGCAYTRVILEWLLGMRVDLTVEELHVDVKDVYRDDGRLVALLRRISPYVKRIGYIEWDDRCICEGVGRGYEYDRSETYEWSLPTEIAHVFDPIPITDEEAHPVQEYAMMSYPGHEPDVSEVEPKLKLPDDEGQPAVRDLNDPISQPAFSTDQETALIAFGNRLTERIVTPMLTSVNASVRWMDEFSLLTVKMFCLLTCTNSKFHRFKLELVFQSVALFRNAPWTVIDDLLVNLAAEIPDTTDVDDEDAMDVDDEDEDSRDLMLIITGGHVRKKKVMEGMPLRDAKRKLPRTVRQGIFDFDTRGFEGIVHRMGPVTARLEPYVDDAYLSI